MEYALIGSGIALSIVTALWFFSDSLEALFNTLTNVALDRVE